MNLNIRGINDIYSERYITTVELIKRFRTMKEKASEEELEGLQVNQIVVDILNGYLSEREALAKNNTQK